MRTEIHCRLIVAAVLGVASVASLAMALALTP